MEERLRFGASRPFNLEEELADEQSRLNADDGSAELDRMLPGGVTAEEAYLLRQQHDLRAAAAAQLRPRPSWKRKAAPPKTTTASGMLTFAGTALELATTGEHVLALIHTGRLKAVNVGQGTKRPRWRIDPDMLKHFKAGHETATPKARVRRTKGSGVEYF